MPAKAIKESRTQAAPAKAQPAKPRNWALVTQSAFILLLALAICRALMTESIRSVTDPLVSGIDAPAAPGAGTTLAINLLCCVPALLVLTRRALDPSFNLVRSWVFWPMLLLAAWAMASPLWAADKFAAVVSASSLASALVFLWSSAQLVRSWLRLRIVAGVAVGLSLALLSTGYFFRLSSLPDLKAFWSDPRNRQHALEENHITPGSPGEFQLEKRVLGGQPMGYGTSTNSYAAVLVLLGVITTGVVIQHRVDKDHWTGIIVPLLAVLATPLAIRWTLCRAAYATPVISAMLLAAIWMFRRKLRPLARPLYFLALLAIAGVTVVIVRHGMRYGTLWHDSLNFRWNYWVASFRMLTQDLAADRYKQLFVGVGWENFGPNYLAHRLQVAAEEIRDPHNFIIRVFAELGLIGGTLLLVWMLKLWWEFTRPILPTDDQDTLPRTPYGGRIPLATIISIGALGMLLNGIFSLDFEAEPAYVVFELIRRLGFAALLAIGIATAAVRYFVTVRVGDARNESDAKPPTRSSSNQRTPARTAASERSIQFAFVLDARPAPWLLYAILVALGTFLIHNLIEFSMFESGLLLLFSLFSGCVLGIRLDARAQRASRPKGGSRRIAVGVLVVSVAIWLAGAVGLFIPIASAEGLAHDADAAARSNRLPDAISEIAEAAQRIPYNADYPMRAARLMLKQRGVMQDATARARVLKLIDSAIAADPSSMSNRVSRAQVELAPEINDITAAQRDYRHALVLDPANIRLRFEYAMALRKLARQRHDPALAGEALLELYQALDRNEQFHFDEPKRFGAAELASIRMAITELEGPQPPRPATVPATGPGRRDRGT